MRRSIRARIRVSRRSPVTCQRDRRNSRPQHLAFTARLRYYMQIHGEPDESQARKGQVAGAPNRHPRWSNPNGETKFAPPSPARWCRSIGDITLRHQQGWTVREIFRHRRPKAPGWTVAQILHHREAPSVSEDGAAPGSSAIGSPCAVRRSQFLPCSRPFWRRRPVVARRMFRVPGGHVASVESR